MPNQGGSPELSYVIQHLFWIWMALGALVILIKGVTRRG